MAERGKTHFERRSFVSGMRVDPEVHEKALNNFKSRVGQDKFAHLVATHKKSSRTVVQSLSMMSIIANRTSKNSPKEISGALLAVSQAIEDVRVDSFIRDNGEECVIAFCLKLHQTLDDFSSYLSGTNLSGLSSVWSCIKMGQDDRIRRHGKEKYIYDSLSILYLNFLQKEEAVRKNVSSKKLSEKDMEIYESAVSFHQVLVEILDGKFQNKLPEKSNQPRLIVRKPISRIIKRGR